MEPWLEADAVMSACGRYRYALRRRWRQEPRHSYDNNRQYPEHRFSSGGHDTLGRGGGREPSGGFHHRYRDQPVPIRRPPAAEEIQVENGYGGRQRQHQVQRVVRRPAKGPQNVQEPTETIDLCGDTSDFSDGDFPAAVDVSTASSSSSSSGLNNAAAPASTSSSQLARSKPQQQLKEHQELVSIKYRQFWNH